MDKQMKMHYMQRIDEKLSDLPCLHCRHQNRVVIN